MKMKIKFKVIMKLIGKKKQGKLIMKLMNLKIVKFKKLTYLINYKRIRESLVMLIHYKLLLINV